MSAVQHLGDAVPAQQPGTAQPLNRSCESCRGLKVRCLPNPETPNQCQRCARGKRLCTFVAPQRRRPRKRTDSRVAQLEREMRAMRVLLKDKRLPLDESSQDELESGEGLGEVDFGTEPGGNVLAVQNVQDSMAAPARTTEYSPGSTLTPQSAGGMSFRGTSLPNAHNSYSPDSRGSDDAIDRGIISMETASELVALFINELAAFFPVVVLPTDTTASQLRQSKPVLFLSMIAAAAIAVDAKLAEILNREMVRLYAERFFIESEKSLELVQSLLIMTVFSYPPNSPLKIQFYQYTHIAATMALEIGLASKRRVLKKPVGSNGEEQHEVFDEHMAEQARAILGCYHFCSHIGMRTRRPNILLFNDWMKECVNHLQYSPHVIDRRLATWFELQKMIDEAMTSFGLDDTSSTAPLTESRVQAILRWFDNRMQDWKKNIPPDLLTVPLMLEYHHTNLAVYELAVGEGYRDPDALKRQHYTLPPPDEDGNPQQPSAPLSAIRVDMTMKWLNAAHSMLDAFLECDTETMRKMPNLIYTRVVLGVMTLMKIYFSVRSGALGEVIGPQSVKVDMYLEEMTRRLTEASGGQKYKIPSRWLFVVGVKARDWYDRFQTRQFQREAGFQAQLKSGKSPSTPVSQYPMPMRNNAQFDHMVPQRIDSFSVPAVVQPTAFENVSGYGAPIPVTAPWPSPDDTFVNLSQHPVYLPGTIPQPMPFEVQNFPVDYGQNNNFFPPGSGMELDGWIPDGSIFGIPSLPGF